MHHAGLNSPFTCSVISGAGALVVESLGGGAGVRPAPGCESHAFAPRTLASTLRMVDVSLESPALGTGVFSVPISWRRDIGVCFIGAGVITLSEPRRWEKTKTEMRTMHGYTLNILMT